MVVRGVSTEARHDHTVVPGPAKEVLWTTIGDLLDSFPAEECRNYLRHCGYEPV